MKNNYDRFGACALRVCFETDDTSDRLVYRRDADEATAEPVPDTELAELAT